MNSSDWVARAASPREANVPGWIQAASAAGEFQPGLPAMRTKARLPFAASTKETHEANTPSNLAAQSPLGTAHGIEQSLPAPQSEWDRGYAAGEAAARAAGDAQARTINDGRMALRSAFRALDTAAMDALAAELTDTVLTLCDAALADCAPDKQALEQRVQIAASRLGAAAQLCTLHLNPDDIAALEDGALSDWKVTADPALERGSIALEGPDGGVRDGPAEWRRAISDALRG